jgi:hypothetical protein
MAGRVPLENASKKTKWTQNELYNIPLPRGPGPKKKKQRTTNVS